MHWLSPGTDINPVDKNGHTALMMAVSKKHDEAALHLLDAGADPCVGKCTIGVLYDGKVRKRGVDNSLSAARRRALLDRLVQCGLPTQDALDSQGNTLLHTLCSLNAPREDIMIILDRCSDINQRNHRGETPLMMLLRSRRQNGAAPVENTLRMLLNAGAEINMADDDGILPFDALIRAAETSKETTGVQARDRELLTLLGTCGAESRKYDKYLCDDMADGTGQQPISQQA